MGIISGLLGRVRGDKERPEYECCECGAGFSRQRQVCPDCGSYHIERTDWRD